MYRLIFASGFAMFSMFFGSGNLVFPIALGFEAGSCYPMALIGLFIGGIIIPFIGLLTTILYNGDYMKFFNFYQGSSKTFLKIQNVIILIVLSIIFALIGSFGVIPRCMWVAFGGLQQMGISNDYFMIFSGIFSILIFIFAWHKNKVIDIIAYILTPFKFGSIFLVLVVGLYMSKMHMPTICDIKQIQNGISKGYQMMDLLATFFFAGSIYQYIQQKLKEQKQNEDQLFSLSLKSCIVGVLLITVIYIGFILLGYFYEEHLQNQPMQQYLPIIAKVTLGQYGLPVVSFTLIMSCLATGTILLSLFSDFFKKNICQNKISDHISLIISISIAFILAQIGFMPIFQFLGAILEYLYPVLMLFTLYRLIHILKVR